MLISIHALREEGDDICPCGLLGYTDFYPRPPRGGRHLYREQMDSGKLFLSTPSARRATRCFTTMGKDYENFYPRPPRGGRHSFVSNSSMRVLFLSTPSARRAT